MMTLEQFLQIHRGGVAVVSISQGDKAWCEESHQDDILESKWYQKVKGCEVERFCIIGGGMYPVELCIDLEDGKGRKERWYV